MNTSFSKRLRVRAREPVSFWRKNEISFVILLITSFCENGVVAKTSPRNVGDLVFLESRKSLSIIIQNNFVKFVAHKE